MPDKFLPSCSSAGMCFLLTFPFIEPPGCRFETGPGSQEFYVLRDLTLADSPRVPIVRCCGVGPDTAGAVPLPASWSADRGREQSKELPSKRAADRSTVAEDRRGLG